jgi:hypothetical protein
MGLHKKFERAIQINVGANSKIHPINTILTQHKIAGMRLQWNYAS